MQQVKMKDQIYNLLSQHGFHVSQKIQNTPGTKFTLSIIGNKKTIVLPLFEGFGTSGKRITLTDEYQQSLLQFTVNEVYKILGSSSHATIECLYQKKIDSKTNEDRVIICNVDLQPSLTKTALIVKQAAEMGIEYQELVELIEELKNGETPDNFSFLIKRSVL